MRRLVIARESTLTYHLFRPGKGKIWHYRFQVANNRVQRSTRLKSEDKADELARREYAAAVVRANGGQPVPTLAELGQAWLDVHRPIKSSAHILSVDKFLRLHTYGLGDKPIGDITTDDVEKARNAHLVGRTASTANHWLRILKLLTLWAVKRAILTHSPWRVAIITTQKRPRSILPMDVTKIWFDAIDKATLRDPGRGTAVRLMFGLGLRATESATARWEWIDWERKTFTHGATKGREAEPVPMPDWLVRHLAPLRKDEGLIGHRKDGTPYPEGFARAPLSIANAACKVRGITPHRLRGTFATLLSEAGVSIQNIQVVMRHKSPLTTMAYLEKNRDRAAIGQAAIAEKIGFERRESGAQRATETTAD